MNCKHCEFIKKLFSISNMKDMTKREYWLMTEIFVHLHDGKDYCNKNKEHMNVKK